MSKLMWIAGILFIAAGIALGLMVFVSTASVIGWGVNLQLVVSLLIGGIVSLGLGSVISGLDLLGEARAQADYGAAAAAPATGIPEFGRRASGAAAHRDIPTETAAVTMAGVTETIEVSEPVKATIEALEQARQDIEQAFDPKPQEAKPNEPKSYEPKSYEPKSQLDVGAEVPPVVEAEVTSPVGTVAVQAEPAPQPAISAETATAEPEAEETEAAETEAIEEGQLYVVEERLIRARPARILSDGTVEAETEEGWMRFENLEHLDEYLDAMAPTA